MTESAADRLRRVQERIGDAARRAGRRSEDITLVAVTKTVPLERILPYLQAGIIHVGENRVQEALAKFSSSPPVVGGGSMDPLPKAAGDDVRPFVHLIGQLQSNKARKAVGFFAMIQSLYRVDLAYELNRHAQEISKKQACLIEVKISPEATKSGLPPERLEEFLGQVQNLANLEIRGLMGIAPLAATGEQARPYFAKLKNLFTQASSKSSSTFNVLSMGMSADFEAAIEEGSTMVRLGAALFGRRQ